MCHGLNSTVLTYPLTLSYDCQHPYHSCGLRSGFDVNVMRLPFHTVVFYALSSNWLGEKAIIWINAEIWYVFWLYHILNFILPRNVDVFIYVVICLCNCIEARDAWMLRSMATLLKFDAAAFVTIQPFQFHMHEFYWSYLYIYIRIHIKCVWYVRYVIANDINITLFRIVSFHM